MMTSARNRFCEFGDTGVEWLEGTRRTPRKQMGRRKPFAEIMFVVAICFGLWPFLLACLIVGDFDEPR